MSDELEPKVEEEEVKVEELNQPAPTMTARAS